MSHLRLFYARLAAIITFVQYKSVFSPSQETDWWLLTKQEFTFLLLMQRNASVEFQLLSNSVVKTEMNGTLKFSSTKE